MEPLKWNLWWSDHCVNKIKNAFAYYNTDVTKCGCFACEEGGRSTHNVFILLFLVNCSQFYSFKLSSFYFIVVAIICKLIQIEKKKNCDRPGVLHFDCKIH